MKTKMVNRGECAGEEGVLFMPESSNEKAYLLRAMELCEVALPQKKSSSMELSRALHEATKEPGMRPWESLTGAEQASKAQSVLGFLQAWKNA